MGSKDVAALRRSPKPIETSRETGWQQKPRPETRCLGLAKPFSVSPRRSRGARVPPGSSSGTDKRRLAMDSPAAEASPSAIRTLKMRRLLRPAGRPSGTGLSRRRGRKIRTCDIRLPKPGEGVAGGGSEAQVVGSIKAGSGGWSPAGPGGRRVFQEFCCACSSGCGGGEAVANLKGASWAVSAGFNFDQTVPRSMSTEVKVAQVGAAHAAVSKA
jgi:hypothetical protein